MVCFLLRLWLTFSRPFCCDIMRKRVAVLGSTGSIGRSALDVAAMHTDLFDVTVLACANNVVRLAHQIQTFRPEMAVVLTEERADELKSILDGMEGDIRHVDIVWGEDGYAMAASHEMVDAVLLAMVSVKPTASPPIILRVRAACSLMVQDFAESVNTGLAYPVMVP